MTATNDLRHLLIKPALDKLVLSLFRYDAPRAAWVPIHQTFTDTEMADAIKRAVETS